MKDTFEGISSEKTFSAVYRFPNPAEETRYCNYYLKEHSSMMYIIYAVVFFVNLSLICRITFDEGWHYAIIPIIINQVLVLVMFWTIKKQFRWYNLLSGIINVAFSVEIFCYENRFSSNFLNNYYQLCGFIIFGAHSNLMLSSQLLYDGVGFLLSFFIHSFKLAEKDRIAEILLMWSVILLSFYQKFQHHKFTRVLYLSMQQSQEWIEVIQNVLPSAVISISNNVNNNDSSNYANTNQKINIKKPSSFSSSHLLSNWTLNLANQQSRIAYQINDMKSFSCFANSVLVDTRELVHEGIVPILELNPLHGNDSSNFSKSHRYSSVKTDKQIDNLDVFNQFSLGGVFQDKTQINNLTNVNKKLSNISNSTFPQQSNQNLNTPFDKPSLNVLNNQNNTINNNSLTISNGQYVNQRKLSFKQNQLPVLLQENIQQNSKKNSISTGLIPLSFPIPEQKVNNSSEHFQYLINPVAGQGQGGTSSAAIIQPNSAAELGQQMATTMAVGGTPLLNEKSSQQFTADNILGINIIKSHSTMSMNADLNNQQITLFKQLQWMYDDWELTKEQPSEQNKFLIWKFNGKYYPKLLQEDKQLISNIRNEQNNHDDKGEILKINQKLDKLKGEINFNSNNNKKELTQDKKQEDQVEEAIAVQIKVCGFRGRKTRLVLCVDDISVTEKIQLYRSQDKYKDLILANVAHDLRQPLNTLNYTITEAKEQLQRFQNIPDHSQETLQSLMELLDMADVTGSSLKYLINDILDHAKLKEGKLQVNFGQCSLLKITQFTQKMFEFAFKERGIRFRILNKTNIDQIFTDQQRLQQIILNLLSNAIKFTPANKYIILQITKVHKVVRDKQVSLIKIMVMDQGCGMSQEQLDQIFAPYVSFNHQNLNIEGIGLGLHICKSIIGLLGPYPKLYVKSKLQQGTKFFFYIYHQFRKNVTNKVQITPPPPTASFPPAQLFSGDDGVRTPQLPGLKVPSKEDNQEKDKNGNDISGNNQLLKDGSALPLKQDKESDKKVGYSLELSGLNELVEKKCAMSIVEHEEKDIFSYQSFQANDSKAIKDNDNNNNSEQDDEDQNSELNMTSLVMQLPDIDENDYYNYQADQDHIDGMSRSNLIERYGQTGEINTPITVLNTNRIIDLTQRTFSELPSDHLLNPPSFNSHDHKDNRQHLLRRNSSNLDLSDISVKHLTHTIIHKQRIEYTNEDHYQENNTFQEKAQQIANLNNTNISDCNTTNGLMHGRNDNQFTQNTKLKTQINSMSNNNIQTNQHIPGDIVNQFEFSTDGLIANSNVNKDSNANNFANNLSSIGKNIHGSNSQFMAFKNILTTSKPIVLSHYQNTPQSQKQIQVSSKSTQPQQSHQIPISSISSNTNYSLYSFGNPKVSSVNTNQKIIIPLGTEDHNQPQQQQQSMNKIADMVQTQSIQKQSFQSGSVNRVIQNSNSNTKTSIGRNLREMPFLSRRVSSCSGSLIQVQKEELQVLIADDDSYSIQILKMMLKKSGQFSFITKEVFNGSDSLKEFIRRNKPESKKPFVLVITDINMPIMDGIEATNKMRSAIVDQKCHSAIFIGVSGIDSDRIASDPQLSAQYKVFDVVLSKPLQEQAIINAINQNFLGFY